LARSNYNLGIELCGQYNLKEEELLYKWEAYASNHHLNADEKLSMKHLDKLTRIIQEQKQPVRRNVRAQEYNKDTVHMYVYLHRGRVANTGASILGLAVVTC
jgi:hypothetical protein